MFGLVNPTSVKFGEIVDYAQWGLRILSVGGINGNSQTNRYGDLLFHLLMIRLQVEKIR